MNTTRLQSRIMLGTVHRSLNSVNKAALIQKIIASLDAELELAAKSARAAHEEATHEQSKAENKYDTRGLEASYLAHGQSRQAAETLQARKEFSMMKPHPFGRDDAIDVGALVELQGTGDSSLYFIGPRAGGTEILHQKRTIMVITPQSPLGRQLLGRKQGDKLSIEVGATRTNYVVSRVE